MLANTSLVPAALDVTGGIAAAVNATMRALAPGLEVWAGEIGPHNGGSPPCNSSALRWATFADTFWYVDALGSKARHGYQAFCRQDFVGADYGLLDCASHTPLPDFYGAAGGGPEARAPPG